MTDIETRIAELLNDIIVDSQQVVTIQHTEKVMEVMGEANSFKIDDDKTQKKTETKALRKLFRDPDDRFLGGVASGVSNYFGLQVKWVRLIWLLLGLFSWGGFSILYIALWIFMPLAKTTSEKFMMKGQAISLSNLEKKLKKSLKRLPIISKTPTIKKPNAKSNQRQRGFLMR